MAKAEQTATGEAKIYVNPAGFARTDALTRIGNQVFAVDMQNNRNFAQSNAAVRYPQIWDASWFNWVQYNSSISDPLIRNIGEASGGSRCREAVRRRCRAVREQRQYREPQGDRGTTVGPGSLPGFVVAEVAFGVPEARCARRWNGALICINRIAKGAIALLLTSLRADLALGESQVLVAEQTGQALPGRQRRAARRNRNRSARGDGFPQPDGRFGASAQRERSPRPSGWTWSPKASRTGSLSDEASLRSSAFNTAHSAILPMSQSARKQSTKLGL